MKTRKKSLFCRKWLKISLFSWKWQKKSLFCRKWRKKALFSWKWDKYSWNCKKSHFFSLFRTRPFQNDFFSAFFHSRPLFFRNFQKSSESCSKRFFYKKGPIGFPYNSPHKTHFSIENHFFVGFSLSSFSEVFSGQLAPLLPDSKKNTKKVTFLTLFCEKETNTHEMTKKSTFFMEMTKNIIFFVFFHGNA